MSQAVAGTPVAKTGNGAQPDPIQDFVRSAALHIRRTELFYGWMVWLTGLLFALTLFILIDHWLWEFNRFTRLAVFGCLALWSCWWLVRRVIPPMLYPINPEHAARVIEQQLPDTKDSLISWLQLNHADASPPKSVLNQIGRYAFRYIKNADSTQVADTANLIRLSAAFFGCLLCVAVYFFASPKSGWTSASRLLFPWANIEPATRVQFVQITPGATTVMQGSSLPLDVMLRGLHKHEKVQLRYDLSDGQVQGEVVPLREEIQGVHYKLDFGKSFGGIHQPLTYWITAGDAKAGPFKVDIQVVPLVAIDQIQLNFPPYTQLKSRTLVQQGQFEVPEGTVASFSALANQEMQKARIEFDPILQGKTLLSVGETVDMKVEGSKLSADWVATVDSKSRKKRESNYRIKATNTLHESNHDPVIYPVKVIPDLPPEVEFGSGIVGPIDVPIDHSVSIEILATDPDYGLTSVDLIGLVENRLRPNEPKELFQQSLLEASEDEPLKKSFDYALQPSELGLQVGDVFDIVVVAKDNYHTPGTKQLTPQEGRTSPLRVRIVQGAAPPQDGAGDPGQDSRIASKDATEVGNDVNKREKIDWSKVPQNDPRNSGKGSRTERSKEAGDQGENAGEGQDSQQAQGPGLGSGGESGAKGGANKEGQRNNNGQSTAKSGTNGQHSGKAQDGAGASGGQSGSEEMNQGEGTGEANGSKAGSERGESLLDDRNAFNRIEEFMKDQSKGSANDRANAEKDARSRDREDTNGERTGGENSSGANSARSEKMGQDTTGSGKGSDQKGEGSARQESDVSKGSDDQNNPSANSAGKDSAGKDSAGKEGAGKDSAGKDSAGKDSAGKDSAGKDSAGKDSAGKDSAGKDSAGKEGAGKEGAGKEGAGKEGAGKEGAGANEIGKSQTGKQGASGQKENQVGNDKGGSQSDGKDPKGSRMNGEEKRGADQANAEKGGADRTGGDKSSEQRVGSEKSGAEDSGDGRSNAGKEGAGKEGSGKEGAGKEGTGKEGTGKDGAGKDGAGKEGTGKEGTGKEGTGKDGAGKDGAGKDGAGKEGSGKDGAGKEGAGKEGAGKEGGSKGSGEKGDLNGKTGEAPAVKANRNPGEDGEKASSKEQGGGQGSGSEEGGEDGPQSAGEPNSAGSGMNQQGRAPKGGGSGESKQSQGGEFGSDRAKVEYADKATDMMLEYIDRQKDQPDPELLKRLNWSADDLRQFADRWKRAKEQAKTDPSKRVELEETLRNLGLSGTGQKVNQLKDRNDGLRGMREEGGRLRPPESLREQFEAFRKAAGKLGK